MLRVLLEQLLQDGDRLELVSVAHVGLRGRRLQGQRIENQYLVVVRVALRHLLHRAVVGAQAGLDVGLVMISGVSADRGGPGALAIRLRANLARLLHAAQAALAFSRDGGLPSELPSKSIAMPQ